eukprot:m.89190 g.89190  ORF g.89190 m.89190 type:complete len:319 (-) comp14967_c0_seq1:31-987(-)
MGAATPTVAETARSLSRPALRQRVSEAAVVLFNPLTYVQVPNLVYLALAAAVYALSFPCEVAPSSDPSDLGDTGRPGAVAVGSLRAVWPVTVLFRNLAVGIAVYSAWHHVLYVNRIAKTKFNPQIPQPSQHTRDQRWTIAGLGVGTLFEVVLTAAYGCGVWPVAPQPEGMMTWGLWFAAVWLVACFWSDVHFYLVHRAIHPWGWKLPLIGDPGYLLYTRVHYLHHRSPNPGPWAGLAMHPIEHVLYFSRSLMVLVIPCHPIHMLFINLRAMIGPAPGHHGFAEYGGSQFHYLHHAKFSCNYGTRGSLDKVFGTYRDTD